MVFEAYKTGAKSVSAASIDTSALSGRGDTASPSDALNPKGIGTTTDTAGAEGLDSRQTTPGEDEIAQDIQKLYQHL